MRNDLIQKVKAINFPLGQYAVFGSGPMVLHGLRNSQDVDLIVTSDFYTQLKLDPKYEIKHWADGAEYLADGNFEITNTWDYETYKPNIEKLIEEAEIVDGVPFVQLSQVMLWKRAFGRDKDFKDIELIEEYLKTNS